MLAFKIIEPLYHECALCCKEIELAYARARRLLDPFEGFMKTLLYENKDVIEKLESFLRANYQFKKSKNRYLQEYNYDSLCVVSGSIIEPLKIMIYYVVEEQEQKYILKMINQFFEGIELNQRKVQFFEEETYEFSERKLLLEVIVK